ncbi:hypothetical protein [Streptomyces sp. SAI-129]|uniref:hypothetical protein n=1 Tax=Streptomyces sp. SAI-129 TaxID=3377727 RepID=UPI003C7C4424
MAPRLLAAGLVLAGAPAASACGPLTVPGSTANAAPAHAAAAGGGRAALAQKTALRTVLESCPAEAGQR